MMFRDLIAIAKPKGAPDQPSLTSKELMWEGFTSINLVSKCKPWVIRHGTSTALRVQKRKGLSRLKKEKLRRGSKSSLEERC